ncbi:hypothetical protein RUM43_012137 [Polyplax serrata]|uniref:Protein kinase domain-containing protein n=1 Tax=Polyplax serrata TaxID=468196 RepID=A0AAN8Q3R1_POLSC
MRFASSVLLVWTLHVFQLLKAEEDYKDSELAAPQDFKLENGKTLNLNESQYCLESISADIVSGKSYDKSLYYIKIKWTSGHLMTSIKLESNSLSDSYCEARNKHYYNRKPLNKNVHIFPDDVNKGIRFLPIKLDCKYIITPELEGICRPIKLQYAAPVCINNDTCACRNIFIPAPDIHVELLREGVNVIWSFPKNFNSSQSTIVISIYQEDGINIKKVAGRKVVTENFNLVNGIKQKEYFQMNTSNGNNFRVESYFDSYWFDYRDLIIVREIGNGNFGVVYLATTSKDFKGTNHFAVKQVKGKAGPEDLADFVEEINTFKLVGSHPNVVKMFGYCGTPHPLTIIMEYVPFNLLKYLKTLRMKFERRRVQTECTISYAQLSHSKSSSTLDLDYTSQSEVEDFPIRNPVEPDRIKSYNELDHALDNRDLEVFGLQIARGMAHLESRAIIHRDLAARNVLMDSFKNLKISDFGMSRTGIYVNKTTRKFPLRWMSPEALLNRIYSNKSDVWSFGIVLWEIGTLGAFPYSSLQNEEVISFLKKGGHLDRPDNVTGGLYTVMVNCWARLADDRPTFRELVQKLEEFCARDNGYVDFGRLESNYVFPPMEEEVDITKKLQPVTSDM